jgi:hypothetical protein
VAEEQRNTSIISCWVLADPDASGARIWPSRWKHISEKVHSQDCLGQCALRASTNKVHNAPVTSNRIDLADHLKRAEVVSAAHVGCGWIPWTLDPAGTLVVERKV